MYRRFVYGRPCLGGGGVDYDCVRDCQPSKLLPFHTVSLLLHSTPNAYRLCSEDLFRAWHSERLTTSRTTDVTNTVQRCKTFLKASGYHSPASGHSTKPFPIHLPQHRRLSISLERQNRALSTIEHGANWSICLSCVTV
jgi:hypothetical protein